MRSWSVSLLGLGMLCLGASCDKITPLSIEIVLPVGDNPPLFSTLVFGASDGTTTVQQSFPASEEKLELPVIPYGEDWVLSLEGRAEETPISFGKTVPLSLNPGEEITAKLFFAQINAFHVPPNQPSNELQPLSLAGLPPLSVSACALPEGGFGFVGGKLPEFFSPASLSFSPIESNETVMGAICAASQGGALLIGGAQDTQANQLCDELASLDQVQLSEGQASQDLARIAHQATTFTTPKPIRLPDGTQLETGTTLIFVSGGKNGAQTLGQVGLIILGPNQAPRIYKPIDPTQQIMLAPRAAHSATLVQFDGQTKLLLAGGLGASGEALATTELLDLSTFEVEAGPLLNEPRAGMVSVLLPDGDVLFIGGQDQQQSSARIERFSPRFLEIVVEPQLLFTRRGHSATRLESGLILLAGGIGKRVGTLDAEQILSTGELFDPEDASQSGTIFTRPLNQPRVGHAAVLLSNGLVLLVGGTQQLNPQAEFYTPVPKE
jgi:hypothetical protein